MLEGEFCLWLTVLLSLTTGGVSDLVLAETRR